jgi:hypothetical protein
LTSSSMQRHLDDVVGEPHDPLSDGELPQERRKLGGIEMVGVGVLDVVTANQHVGDLLRLHGGRGPRGKEGGDALVEDGPVEVARRSLGVAEHRRGEARVVEGLAARMELEPPLGCADAARGLEALERVVEVALGLPPVHEADGELVGAAALRHPILLREAEKIEEELDGAERRLTDSDGADVRRFDERDGRGVSQRLDEIGCRHPPRRSTAHDNDSPGHVLVLRSMTAWERGVCKEKWSGGTSSVSPILGT